MSIENFTIANFYFRKHFENAVKIGVDPEVMRRATGISEALLDKPLARIAPESLARLFHIIWESGDDEFLGMGFRPVRYGSFSWLTNQLVLHKTLGDIYDTMAGFYNLLPSGIRFELQRDEKQARFILHHAPELAGKINLLIDFLLLIWHRFPGWLIGKTISLHRVELAFAEPWHSAEYRFVFPAACCFEQKQSALVFDSQWLDAPIVQNKTQLDSYLKQIPLQWFQKQRFSKLLSDQVGQLLAEQDRNMDEIAEKLHMTARTLRRKLIAEGLGFQQLRDDLRRDRAINLLAVTDLTIGEIGRHIGFTEPATFSRAFRHWTGLSPLGYRRGLNHRRTQSCANK